MENQVENMDTEMNKWDKVVKYKKFTDTLGDVAFFIPENSFSNKNTKIEVSDWMTVIPTDLRRAGYPWRIRVTEGDYLKDHALPKYMRIEMKIIQSLDHLDVGTLKIYFQGLEEDGWLGLPTLIDRREEKATAYYYKMGKYILLGKLKCGGKDKFEPINDSPNFHHYMTPKSGYVYIPGPHEYKMSSEIPQLLDSQKDEDWVLFLARKGKSYLVETNPDEGVKPEIILQRLRDGVNISTNEINRFDAGLKLTWTPKDNFFSKNEEDNQILVKVIPASDSVVGCSGSYNFRLSEF